MVIGKLAIICQIFNSFRNMQGIIDSESPLQEGITNYTEDSLLFLFAKYKVGKASLRAPFKLY